MLSFTHRVDLVSNGQCAAIAEDCDHAGVEEHHRGALSENEEEEEEEEEQEHSSSGE